MESIFDNAWPRNWRTHPVKCKLTLWLLLLVSGFVHATNGDRSVITTKHMPALPDQVLQAFLNDEDLKAWWRISRSLVEPSIDGIWSIAWDDWGEEKTQHAWSGVIDALSDRKLVIGRMVMNEPGMPLLGPMQVEIQVAPAEGGSTVTVTHRGYGYGEHWDKIYDDVVQGWDHVLSDMQTWFQEEY